MNHGEISLQTERDGHVDTASHAGLGQGQAVGHQVGPQGGGVVRAQLGQGEGQEGGDQEPGVHQGQDEHQPQHIIVRDLESFATHRQESQSVQLIDPFISRDVSLSVIYF